MVFADTLSGDPRMRGQCPRRASPRPGDDAVAFRTSQIPRPSPLPFPGEGPHEGARAAGSRGRPRLWPLNARVGQAPSAICRSVAVPPRAAPLTLGVWHSEFSFAQTATRLSRLRAKVNCECLTPAVPAPLLPRPRNPCHQQVPPSGPSNTLRSSLAPSVGGFSNSPRSSPLMRASSVRLRHSRYCPASHRY